MFSRQHTEADTAGGRDPNCTVGLQGIDEDSIGALSPGSCPEPLPGLVMAFSQFPHKNSILKPSWPLWHSASWQESDSRMPERFPLSCHSLHTHTSSHQLISYTLHVHHAPWGHTSSSWGKPANLPAIHRVKLWLLHQNLNPNLGDVVSNWGTFQFILPLVLFLCIKVW